MNRGNGGRVLRTDARYLQKILIFKEISMVFVQFIEIFKGYVYLKIFAIKFPFFYLTSSSFQMFAAKTISNQTFFQFFFNFSKIPQTSLFQSKPYWRRTAESLVYSSVIKSFNFRNLIIHFTHFFIIYLFFFCFLQSETVDFCEINFQQFFCAFFLSFSHFFEHIQKLTSGKKLVDFLLWF